MIEFKCNIQIIFIIALHYYLPSINNKKHEQGRESTQQNF